MLQMVNFSCGHAAEVKLYNDKEKREQRIKELEKTGLCPACLTASYEKEDKENAKKCVCVRMSNERKEREYPDCAERKTGFPKEKDYSYVFIPAEALCVEAIKKLIKAQNISYGEAMEIIEKAFAEKYHELYTKADALKEVIPDIPAPVAAEPVTKVSEMDKEDVAENIDKVINSVQAEKVINTETHPALSSADKLFSLLNDMPEAAVKETKEEEKPEPLQEISFEIPIPEVHPIVEPEEAVNEEPIPEPEASAAEEEKSVSTELDELFGETEEKTAVPGNTVEVVNDIPVTAAPGTVTTAPVGNNSEGEDPDEDVDAFFNSLN